MARDIIFIYLLDLNAYLYDIFRRVCELSGYNINDGKRKKYVLLFFLCS